MEIYKVSSMGNKTKWLEKNLGGKWVYHGRGGFYRNWYCEDGRRVRYTAAPLDQFDEPCGPPQCWIDLPNEARTVPFYWKLPVPVAWKHTKKQPEGEQ